MPLEKMESRMAQFESMLDISREIIERASGALVRPHVAPARDEYDCAATLFFWTALLMFGIAILIIIL